MSIDEISMMLGKLCKGQEDTSAWLADLKKDIADLKTGGCSRGADHDRRITNLEEAPQKLALGTSGIVSVITSVLMDMGRKLMGQ